MTPVIGSSTNDEFLKPNTAVYRTLPNSPVSGSTALTVVTRTPAVAFSGSWTSYAALVNRGALSLTSSKYTITGALAKVRVRFVSPPSPPCTDSSVANTCSPLKSHDRYCDDNRRRFRDNKTFIIWISLEYNIVHSGLGL